MKSLLVALLASSLAFGIKEHNFESGDFKGSKGTRVHATLENGLSQLRTHAMNERNEVSWAFDPDNHLWINISDYVSPANVYIDSNLSEYVDSTFKNPYFIHTHQSNVYLEWDGFGKERYLFPSVDDVLNALATSYTNKNSRHIIVSESGGLMLWSDSIQLQGFVKKFFSPDAGNAAIDIQKSFKSAPPSDYSGIAEKFKGCINIKYIPIK